MKIIADSGSTKIEWVLIDEYNTRRYIESDGVNPYFATDEQLVSGFQLATKDISPTKVGSVYFYGAGCGRTSSQNKVQNAISYIFPKAKIKVESDLLGAAKAVLGNKSGIVGVLGTGSNACMYDGEKITKRVPSLGFMLGDEGSGGYFGKRLLKDYFYKKMPEDFRSLFEENHSITLEQVLDDVYTKTQPNRYVAAFADVLSKHSTHPYAEKIIREGFSEFVIHQLDYLGESKEHEVSFSGSIAAIYSELLEEVLAEHDYKLGAIIQKPLENLVKFHSDHDK